MKDWCLGLHEMDILVLKLKIKSLQKQIDKDNAEIEKLRKYNREILGRK